MTAASAVSTSTLISGKETADGKVRRVAPPRVTVSPGVTGCSRSKPKRRSVQEIAWWPRPEAVSVGGTGPAG